METLLSYADPVAGIIGFIFLYSIPLGLILCAKTKRGRKFLGMEQS
jgi:hypothetical protein